MVAGQRRDPPVAYFGVAYFGAALSVSDDEAIPVVVSWHSAPATKASSKSPGNFFPRWSARRSIPLQACALKKYRCGIGPSSKICDKEHTLASLWNSEVLSIENTPREPGFRSGNHTCGWPSGPVWRPGRHIAPDKDSQETSKGVVFGVKHAEDVFPKKRSEGHSCRPFHGPAPQRRE